MIIRLEHDGVAYTVNTEQFYDLSIPVGTTGPLAWYLDHPVITPVRDENWVGSVAEGGSVNFRNIFFNPHGHGTHTEGPGHVVPEVHSIDRALGGYHLMARLITVHPATRNGDEVITFQDIQAALAGAGTTDGHPPKALILRTGTGDRSTTNWSNTNPPYLAADAAAWMAGQGIEHLLIDLPSVDRESDGGTLAAHKAFWQLPDQPRMQATITELIQVPREVRDGLYWLNLQIAPFVNDAAPSRPLIFPLNQTEL